MTGSAAATDAEAAADAGLFEGYAGRMLVVGVLGSLTMTAGQVVLSPLLPAIIDSLGISPARAGLALSAMAGLAGLARYPGGRFADALSRKTVLVAALVTLAGGFLAVFVAPGYPAFVAGAALVGVGAGLYTPSVAALLSDLFAERRGRAFGLNSASISVGGALASGLAVAVLAVGPWRLAFAPVVVVVAVLALSMHRWNREPYVAGRPSLALRETATRLLATPELRRTLVALVVLSVVWRGTIGFLPTLLQVEKGLSPALASAVYGSLFVVGVGASPVAGWLGDRFGHAAVAAAVSAVGLVGLSTVVLAEGVVAVTAGVLVFALGLTAVWPVLNTYVMVVAPTDSMGGDFGALGTVYIGVGAVGPTYVGVVAERASYGTAFAGLVACLLVAVAVMATLVRRS